MDYTQTQGYILGKMTEMLDVKGLAPEVSSMIAVSAFSKAVQANGAVDSDYLKSVAKIDTFLKERLPKEPTPITIEKRPVNMVATNKTAEEIRTEIHTLNTFMLFDELLLAGEMQRYAYRILGKLKEKGLYRHQLKQSANRLKEVVDGLQVRSNNSDKDITLKQCMMISPGGFYGKDFYEDGGGLLNRMSMNFSREYNIKLKRILLDNRWMADSLNVKHPDLIAEIFTLVFLAQTDIELYDEVQKQIRSTARGRLKSRCIKSMHSESMRNVANNLLDQFIPRNFEVPEERRNLMRQHVKEFQQDITGKGQFEFMDGQTLALKMDFIEYYLGRLRMDMDKGMIGVAHIREVWRRLGSKNMVRKFFKELKGLPKKKEDMDDWDYSKVVATSDSPQHTMNCYRRLCTVNECIPMDDDPEDVWDKRILRTMARKCNGMLPDFAIRGALEKYKTKKKMEEVLKEAGIELAATLRRVRKMKRSEIEQLGED